MTMRATDLQVFTSVGTTYAREASQAGRCPGDRQLSGRRESRPNLEATKLHKVRDHGHSTRRCSAVSRFRQHKGQK
jgi:hypothetical protein